MRLFRPLMVGLVGVGVLLGNNMAYAVVGNADSPTAGTTKPAIHIKKHRKHKMMHHMKMMKKY